MASYYLPVQLVFRLLLLLLADSAFCQQSSPINTDRPDQSNGVYTLPKHDFQLETGLTYGNTSGDYFLHNTMIRYGLMTKTELRLEVDYGLQQHTGGILPASLSVKQAIREQAGVLPAITAVGSIGLPFSATSNFRPDKVPVALALAFENELSDQFSFSYNFGPFLDGENSRLNWLVTANMGYSPMEKWSLFAEYFSNFTRGLGPEHNIDIGLLWLLKNNLQLDLAAGTAMFGGAEKNPFITTGISYRFD